MAINPLASEKQLSDLLMGSVDPVGASNSGIPLKTSVDKSARADSVFTPKNASVDMFSNNPADSRSQKPSMVVEGQSVTGGKSPKLPLN